MHDSGNRQSFKTGAVRDMADDKPRPDLYSPFAEERVGQWLRLGAVKYSERNGEKGIPNSRCFASLRRHAMRYHQGDRSEDQRRHGSGPLVAIEERMVLNDMEEICGCHPEGKVMKQLPPESCLRLGDCVGSQDEARKRLQNGEYSYVLLDLEIPVRYGQKPRPNATWPTCANGN